MKISDLKMKRSKNNKAFVKPVKCKSCGEYSSVEKRLIGGEPYWVNVFNNHKNDCIVNRVHRRLGFKKVI